MNYRRVGRTALRASAIGLGTMNFGPRTPEIESFRLLDRAVDAGINLIDTADQYGGQLGPGATEDLLGRWLATRRDRDRLIVATKVHERVGDGPNDRGLSAYHIRRACDASLRRLGVDHIDLYQLHHPDRDASWDEVFEAAECLHAQGKITYLGTSNFPGWALAAGAEIAKARSVLGPVTEQHLYNLLQRTAELEVIPAACHYGIGLLPWSPLAGGVLGGPSSDDVKRRDGVAERSASIEPTLESWTRLCRQIGHPPAVVATAWLKDRPGVMAPIVGPRTESHLEAALAASELILEQSVLDTLDRIFPGPGPAPEAYAW